MVEEEETVVQWYNGTMINLYVSIQIINNEALDPDLLFTCVVYLVASLN